MADLTRKTANIYDKYHTIELTDLGTRYGQYVDKGTYSIYNDTNNIVYWFANGGYSRFRACEPHSTATVSLTEDYNNVGFYMAYNDDSLGDVSIVQGSTAPDHYIPYWQHSLRKLTTATEAVENPLYSDGTAITSYTIKGNTVQNGTPTPSNPDDVNGVGVRTANLYNYQTVVIGKYINSEGEETPSAGVGDNLMNHTDYINITSGENYYFKIRKTYDAGASSNAFCWFDSNKNLISRDLFDMGYNNYIYATYTAPQNAAYLIVNFRGEYYDTGMLNIAAAEFEPYGYKIPISSANTTTPVYLGEVETTRFVKKLVLTGNEEYISDPSYSRFITVFPNAKIEGLRLTQVYCTHFTSVYDGRPISEVPNNSIYSSDVANNRFFIKTTNYTTAADFESYLAQQYANGTPVTVWYVLATPETAAVNEPLMKIGDYADTLSNATAIPTTEGANSITVDTTVQPSEFTATWTGWHDANVKEWDGSDWS